MQQFRLRSAFIVAFMLLFSLVKAQTIDSVLRILDSRYPQEKIYLHYDKSFYNPGETIWFKAYLFSGAMPSQISRTLYAELIDAKGKVLEKRSAPIVMAGAAAAFDIPATFEGNTVYVRAYTDWMLNFDSTFLYQKSIPVIQEKNNVKPQTPKNFLQFFPEGGDLVHGIQSRVAFKATDIHGLPYAVSGNITDSKGKTVIAFNSIHDGMGYFTFVPEGNEKYKAIWKDASGKQQQTALPQVKQDGVVLQLDQDPSGVQFKITRPETGSKFAGPLQIVGQMQQQLVYLANANMSQKKNINGNIPVENLPAGILQITVFTADKKPLAERILFVNKPDYYFITDLNGALKSYDKRKKNVFQIDVPDTLRTNLSVSVTDASVNPHLKGEEDIFSNILLTSDVKGYVHNPAYYFSSEVDSVLAHRDLVMMTNGWRRFKWENVLAGKFPKITHMPGDYITLSGKVNGLTKSQLVNKELSGILEIDNKPQFLNIPVSTDGKFTVPGLIFFDTAKLYYQFNNDKDKVLTSRAGFDVKSNLLQADMPFRSDSSSIYRSVLPPNEVLAKNKELAEKNIAVLDARRKVETLGAVTVTARKKTKQQEMDEQYTSGLFSGGDANTFIVEDDISAQGAMTILQYLQGRVAGLQITGQGSQMGMQWRGGTPSLFLNEMQSDVNMIQNIPMANVAMVKVFRPPFLGAPGGGAGGAIAVYTKKGAAANSDFKGLDFTKIAGYDSAREFYSPDYSKYDERHTDADYRSTLYWNPFVLTDSENRRLFFTFYNNDVTKRFRIVIEGCNENGQLTRIEKIFE